MNASTLINTNIVPILLALIGLSMSYVLYVVVVHVSDGDKNKVARRQLGLSDDPIVSNRNYSLVSNSAGLQVYVDTITHQLTVQSIHERGGNRVDDEYRDADEAYDSTQLHTLYTNTPYMVTYEHDYQNADGYLHSGTANNSDYLHNGTLLNITPYLSESMRKYMSSHTGRFDVRLRDRTNPNDTTTVKPVLEMASDSAFMVIGDDPTLHSIVLESNRKSRCLVKAKVDGADAPNLRLNFSPLNKAAGHTDSNPRTFRRLPSTFRFIRTSDASITDVKQIGNNDEVMLSVVWPDEFDAKRECVSVAPPPPPSSSSFVRAKGQRALSSPDDSLPYRLVGYDPVTKRYRIGSSGDVTPSIFYVGGAGLEGDFRLETLDASGQRVPAFHLAANSSYVYSKAQSNDAPPLSIDTVVQQ